MPGRAERKPEASPLLASADHRPNPPVRDRRLTVSRPPPARSRRRLCPDCDAAKTGPTSPDARWATPPPARGPQGLMGRHSAVCRCSRWGFRGKRSTIAAPPAAPAEKTKAPLCRAFVRADDGTRTHDLLHGNAFGRVCADNRTSMNLPALQGFLRPSRGSKVRSGCGLLRTCCGMYAGWFVARLANGQRCSHLRVHMRLGSLLRSGVGRRAERGEADAGAGGLLRAAGRSRSGRLLRGSRRVTGHLGRQRIRGLGLVGVVERRRPRHAASRRQPGGRSAAAGAGAGADDHRAQRSTSRRASGGRSRSGWRRCRATTSSSRARRASACCTR